MDLQSLPVDTTKLYGLPKYLTTENNHKAYLTISTDLGGKWCAGYTRWFDSKIEGDPGGYDIVGPSINGALTVDEALQKLAKQMEKEKS